MARSLTSLAGVRPYTVDGYFTGTGFAVMGLVRGIFGHFYCPSHRVFLNLMNKAETAGKIESAGAKMFANKLLFVAATIASVLYFAGNSFWVVPTIALVIFSSLEWVFSFCAACWVYSFWYKMLPPKMVG